MSESITLRGEHVRYLRYRVNGGREATHKSAERNYGETFANAEQKFYDNLFQRPDIEIKIVTGQADSVCSLCLETSNQAKPNCSSPQRDQEELAEMNLAPGTYKLKDLMPLLKRS